MSDVFEDREDLIPHRARLFRLIDETPFLNWLLLTKRPENIKRLSPQLGQPNVWLGVSAENQRIGICACRFSWGFPLSCILCRLSRSCRPSRWMSLGSILNG